MSRTHRVVVPLRILLAMVFAALLVAQALALPAVFRTLAEESPELASLRWPMLTISRLELVCVQVVIVCTWRLLTMVKNDRIFSEQSMVWVNVIVGAIAVAWVLLLGVFVYFVVAWGLSGLPAVLLVLLLVGAALGLLMVVMRALLRQATTLRTDMEAVI